MFFSPYRHKYIQGKSIKQSSFERLLLLPGIKSMILANIPFENGHGHIYPKIYLVPFGHSVHILEGSSSRKSL